MCDFVAAAIVVGLQVQSKVAGRDAGRLRWPAAATAAARRWRRCARVELADHLVDDVINSWRSATNATSGLYLARMASQSGAVELGVVETILHATPGIVKHLLPFVGLLDPDGTLKLIFFFEPPPAGEGARRNRLNRLPARAQGGPSGDGRGGPLRRPARPSARRSRRRSGRYKPTRLLEVERAAVPGEAKVGDPAAKAAAEARGGAVVACGRRRRGAGGDPGHPLAVVLDRVDRTGCRRPTRPRHPPRARRRGTRLGGAKMSVLPSFAGV